MRFSLHYKVSEVFLQEFRLCFGGKTTRRPWRPWSFIRNRRVLLHTTCASVASTCLFGFAQDSSTYFVHLVTAYLYCTHIVQTNR